MPDEEVIREEEVLDEPVEARRQWAEEQRAIPQPIYVDVGRATPPVEVQAGAPFEETVKGLADEAHYGGVFRVFLNGSEIVSPEDAPATIEPGMRLAITSYDKVG